MNHSSNDVKVTSPNQLFTQYYVTRCLWRWWSRTWPSPPTRCCPTSFWSQCSPAWSTEPWRKTLWWRVAGLYFKILLKAKETKQSNLSIPVRLHLLMCSTWGKDHRASSRYCAWVPSQEIFHNPLCQGLAAMDTGARDSLADVISRSLTKLATQPEGKVTF